MTDAPEFNQVHSSNHRNGRVLAALTVLPLVTLGLSFAAVPLYDMFCRMTGFGGTTQVSSGNPKGVIARDLAVRFDATVDRSMPLKVEAARTEINPIGTVSTVIYRATNLSAEPLRTTAGFNVAPNVAGLYFNKIECFCFTEQVIPPHATVEMPIVYFIDPEYAEVFELRTVNEITLSYSFYAQ